MGLSLLPLQLLTCILCSLVAAAVLSSTVLSSSWVDAACVAAWAAARLLTPIMWFLNSSSHLAFLMFKSWSGATVCPAILALACGNQVWPHDSMHHLTFSLLVTMFLVSFPCLGFAGKGTTATDHLHEHAGHQIMI